MVYLCKVQKSYNFLRDAAQISDFAGRFALVEHLKKTTDMDSTERVGAAMDMFHDYDLPTNRMVNWMNKIGMLLFTKYFVRVMKIMYNTLVANPARVIAQTMLQHVFFDVTDIYDTSLNPLSRLGMGVSDFIEAPLEIASVNAVRNIL